MAKSLITNEQRKSMTFLQAEGLEELPSVLRWGEVDKDIRLRIWGAYYALLDGSTIHSYSGSYFGEACKKLMMRTWRFHLRMPLDEAEKLASEVNASTKTMKSLVMGTTSHDLLDFVQFTLREPLCGNSLARSLRAAITGPHSPYFVLDDPPTIIPKGSPEEGATVAQDLKAIKESGFSGARAHLIAAAEALNKGDERGAIREAVHAVESASKKVTAKPDATLPNCLKTLEKERGLHPALKKGFESLYAYTSDEKGIRHALTEGENKNVGTDEAIFMFSACTAFVSYLARKFPEQS